MQTPTIDIHGMTSKEAVKVLRLNLKEFHYRGFSEVYVVHGKGSGILRKTTKAVLKQSPYVKTFRLGKSGEGGSGVTVVALKQ